MIELPVRSDRLVIDALTVDDASDVAAYRNDPDVARFQAWPLPYGVEEAAGLAAAGQLAIRDGEARAGRTELVGDAMLDRVPATEHAVEIGITLAPAAQGRGLATEAVTALVDAVFAAGRQKVVAYVDVRNERSLALFDRVGSVARACCTTASRGPDGLIDEVLFGLTADVWRHPTDGPVVELDPHPADVDRLVRGADGVQRRRHRRPRRHRHRLCSSATSSAASSAARPAWPGPAAPSCGCCGSGRTTGGRGSAGACSTAFEDAARTKGARRVFLEQPHVPGARLLPPPGLRRDRYARRLAGRSRRRAPDEGAVSGRRA